MQDDVWTRASGTHEEELSPWPLKSSANSCAVPLQPTYIHTHTHVPHLQISYNQTQDLHIIHHFVVCRVRRHLHDAIHTEFGKARAAYKVLYTTLNQEFSKENPLKDPGLTFSDPASSYFPIYLDTVSLPRLRLLVDGIAVGNISGSMHHFSRQLTVPYTNTLTI